MRCWIAGAIWISVAWAAGLPREVNSATNTQLCPADVETLTTQLLRDLPSYANRANRSARELGRTPGVSSSVILAGRPEFAPLTLGPGEYTSDAPSPQSEAPQQVFFTTLELQYAAGKRIELQQYHWLFLTHSKSGWRLATMFSRTGSYPGGRPPTPPRESSNGAIGQGIRTWLVDCQAGSVRSRS